MPADPKPTAVRPTPEQLARYASAFNESLTVRSLGMRVSFPDADHVVVELLAEERHRGGMGADAINGGIIAAAFDLVIGCTPALVDSSRRNATVQLNMRFERGLRGSLLRATAHIDRATPHLVFSSAVITDDQGNVCARAEGMVALSDRPWARGDNPGVN